jgi:hypothetical protein
MITGYLILATAFIIPIAIGILAHVLEKKGH